SIITCKNYRTIPSWHVSIALQHTHSADRQSSLRLLFARSLLGSRAALMSESFIRRVPLFAALPPDEAAHLAATLPRRELPANTLLFREGDYGDRCYIVLRGTVEILTAMGTPHEHLIAVRGDGDLIGEMSLLNPDRLRTASVRTRSPIQILE